MASHDENLKFKPDSLTTLAIEAQFLREWRAGKHPRLSVYALRYPAHADALAALVASLPPEADNADSPTGQVETLPESFPERLWNGPGVARALASVFGGLPAQLPQDADAPLRRVAEERGAYDATSADDSSAAQDSAPERPGDD